MIENKTVLIVDDTSDNLMLLSEVLKDEYIVKVSNSGDKAIQIALKTPPDLVLLDVMMPGMDGYSVCQKLKENEVTQSIPVIFISALSAPMDIAAAFEAGGVDYITKPFQPTEVKARVKVHLELRRTRQELQVLLSNTLTGSVKMMLDLLALTQPLLLAQTSRIRRYARELTKLLAISPHEAWNIELASMLAPIGCMGMSQDILKRLHAKQLLSAEEKLRWAEHPAMGAEMVGNIPRLEKVARIIRQQNVPLHELNADENDITYFGTAILQMLTAFDTLVVSGTGAVEAMNSIAVKPYPTWLKDGLKKMVSVESERKPERIAFGQLRPGMVLAEDLTGKDGNLLMGNGSELSTSLIRVLHHFSAQGNCVSHTVLVFDTATD